MVSFVYKQRKKLYKALLHDSDNGIAESLLLMISKSYLEHLVLRKS